MLQFTMTQAHLEWHMGDRIRKAMKVRGVSQLDLCEYLEVSPNAVSSWMNDRHTPRRRDMRLLCEYLGVTKQWLETGEDPDMPSGSPEQCTPRDLNPEPTDSGSVAFLAAIPVMPTIPDSACDLLAVWAGENRA